MTPTTQGAVVLFGLVLFLGPPLRGQPGQDAEPLRASPHRDVSMEDFVRASGGRLALFARNLTTDQEISLNAIGPCAVGGASRFLLAAAAVAQALEAPGTGLDLTLPYTEEGFRGTKGTLGREFGRSHTLRALVTTALRDDDPAAHDLLMGWLGSSLDTRLRAWELSPGVTMASWSERDLAICGHLDARLLQASAPARASWLRDLDASGLVPSHVPEDPRRVADYVPSLDRAWRNWQSRRKEHASLKDLARALEDLYLGRLLDPKPTALLLQALRGVPHVSVARALPLHLATLGLDGTSWQCVTSVAIVETPKATIVVAAHARGYVEEAVASRFLSLMGETAVRRLSPATSRNPETAPPDGLRAIRDIGLHAPEDPPRAEDRSRFKRGSTARLSFTATPEAEATVTVLWTAPDGVPVRENRAVPGHEETRQEFDLVLPRAGWYEVQLALGTRVIHRARFQVSE